MPRHKSGSDQASQLPQPLAPSLLSHSLARLLLIVIVIVFISSSLSLSSLSSLQGISDDGFVTNLPQGGFPCFQSKHLKARSGPGYLTVSAHKGFLLFSCFWTLSVVIDTPCCRPGPSDTNVYNLQVEVASLVKASPSSNLAILNLDTSRNLASLPSKVVLLLQDLSFLLVY